MAWKLWVVCCWAHLNFLDFIFAFADTTAILNLFGDVFSVPGGVAILVGFLFIIGAIFFVIAKLI